MDFIAKTRELIAARKHRDAVKICRVGLLGHPTSTEARLLLGQALLALARYDEVLSEMRATLELSPDCAPATIMLGEALFFKGAYTQARDVLLRASELAPESESVKRLLVELRAADEVGLEGESAEDLADDTRSYPSAVDVAPTDDPTEIQSLVTGATGTSPLPPERPVEPKVVVEDAEMRSDESTRLDVATGEVEPVPSSPGADSDVARAFAAPGNEAPTVRAGGAYPGNASEVAQAFAAPGNEAPTVRAGGGYPPPGSDVARAFDDSRSETPTMPASPALAPGAAAAARPGSGSYPPRGERRWTGPDQDSTREAVVVPSPRITTQEMRDSDLFRRAGGKEEPTMAIRKPKAELRQRLREEITQELREGDLDAIEEAASDPDGEDPFEGVDEELTAPLRHGKGKPPPGLAPPRASSAPTPPPRATPAPAPPRAAPAPGPQPATELLRPLAGPAAPARPGPLPGPGPRPAPPAPARPAPPRPPAPLPPPISSDEFASGARPAPQRGRGAPPAPKAPVRPAPPVPKAPTDRRPARPPATAAPAPDPGPARPTPAAGPAPVRPAAPARSGPTPAARAVAAPPPDRPPPRSPRSEATARGPSPAARWVGRLQVLGRRLRVLGDRLPPAIRGRRLLLVGAGLLVLILAIALPLGLRRGRQRKGLDQQHQQALALIQRGSYRTLQKADTVLVKLLQADPTQARSRSARIYVAALLAAEFGESAQLADELIERGQAAPDAHLAAGKILVALARADLSRAASEAERFDGKFPRSELLAHARCLLSVRQGDPGHAVQLLEDRPTAAQPVLLGRCRTAALLGLGRPADALAALQRVPEAERRAPWAVLLEARLHLAQGAADLPAQLRSDVSSIVEDGQGWTSTLQKRWAHVILAELAGRQAQDAQRRSLLAKARTGSPLDDPALDELLADHLLRFEAPLPAAQVARALKARYPRRVAASLVLAQVALAAGDAKAALAELEAQPRARDLPAATVTRSRAQLLLGQVAEARDGLSRLRREHPGRLDGQLAWAALLAREGKVKEALAELEELLRRTPRDVAIIREAARLELLRGQAAGAVTRLEVAVPLRPGDPTLHAELVNAYLAASAYKSADSALASALSAFPAAAGLLVAQGRLRLALGQLAEAASSFTAALMAQAGLPDALVGLAEAHLLAGQLEAARPAVAAAAAAQPELQPLLEGWLALLTGTRGSDGLDLAERRLHTATTLGPEEVARRAAVLLLELQAKRVDKSRAKRHFTRLRDKLGDHPELRSAYALVLVEADDNGKARDEIAAARNDARFGQLRPPVRAEALARLAQSQWQEGALESAASSAKQAQDLWAGCARALAVSGIVAYERNQYGEARTWLEKAVAANPLLDLAHHYLGLSLKHLGERDRARTHLREYLRLRPKGPLAEDTRRALD